MFLQSNFGISLRAKSTSSFFLLLKHEGYREKDIFFFQFTFISGLFSSFKMYLEMNMEKYSSAKYSQVEDNPEFKENPAGRAAQASNRPIPPPRNLKWGSLRQPSNNQQGEIV